MNFIEGLQNAVNYIEDNITEDIDIAEAAKRAACSTFYFMRIFGILCDVSIGEYIRNRRLTLAGAELAATNIKVIDAAVKYGYDSPESFTRAFVRFHGITPSEARKNGSLLRSFSRVSVRIILKGGNLMEYRIEEKRSFKVLERAGLQSLIDSQNKNTIPAFWTSCRRDGTIDALIKQTPNSKFIYGICYGNQHTDSQNFEYAIAAEYGGGNIPEGFRVTEIPERTWIIFSVTGAMPNAVQEAWHRIISEFFTVGADANAGVYVPTGEMDIEAYTDGDMTSPDYKSEIWVPVKRK